MSDDAAALRQRVADLEQQVERLTPDGDTPAAVPDDQGRTWTVGSLVGEIGLTRRQAIVVLGMLAGGAAFSDALIGAVQAQPTGDEGAVGQSGNRVEVWASELDATEVATDFLNITTTELDTTSAFSNGEQKQFNITGTNAGDRLLAIAVPESDPNNDVGFSVDKVIFDDSEGNLAAFISETESSGGGTARVTVWTIGV